MLLSLLRRLESLTIHIKSIITAACLSMLCMFPTASHRKIVDDGPHYAVIWSAD